MKRLLIGLILILAFPVILWAIPPGGSGSGDMTKAVYDTNADNVVDSAASTTGNAATATALAANGANCSAGYAPLGVDASGAVEGCWQVTPAAIGAESASSNDIDPDRLNGDTTDDNKVDQDILEGFGPSATPSIVMQDSDNAPGTASIYGNSSGGANDIIMTLGVEDSSGGESTAYIELDGVTESVDIKKPLVIESTIKIQSSDDPDLTATGQIAWDTDGWLRTTSDNGTTQKAITVLEEIHATIIKPNDLADATRDKFPLWSNDSGMTFVVTAIEAWSDVDSSVFAVYEYAPQDFSSAAATVEASVDTGTTGTSVANVTVTSIDNPNIDDGNMLVLDFDDTDDPGWVKITIRGYYNGDVN